MRESTVVAEWKAEGRAEGIMQSKQSDLLLVLGYKFGTPVPSDVVSLIQSQADVENLSRWLVSALGAESLDAFRQAFAG